MVHFFCCDSGERIGLRFSDRKYEFLAEYIDWKEELCGNYDAITPPLSFSPNDRKQRTLLVHLCLIQPEISRHCIPVFVEPARSL